MQRYEEFFNSPPFYAFLTLTLTHFVLRVLLVDNEQAALTTYDFAVWGTLVFILIRIVYLYLNTIRPFVRS